MKQHKNTKTINMNTEVTLSFDYSFTPTVPVFLEVPQGYRTTPIGPETHSRRKRSSDLKMTHIRIEEIEDPRFEETYTAYVTRTSTGWSGQIPDVPEVNKCEGTTKQALLTVLKDKLHEALKARSDAWDKQIEEDIKAGKLEPFREEILEDIQAGRLTDL